MSFKFNPFSGTLDNAGGGSGGDFVPYTGADAEVDLNTQNLKVENISSAADLNLTGVSGINLNDDAEINCNAPDFSIRATNSGYLRADVEAGIRGDRNIYLEAGNGATRIDLDSAGLTIDALPGWSGTYATGDARTVTVTKGIITDVS